jgi:hypothetical protein
LLRPRRIKNFVSFVPFVVQSKLRRRAAFQELGAARHTAYMALATLPETS